MPKNNIHSNMMEKNRINFLVNCYTKIKFDEACRLYGMTRTAVLISLMESYIEKVTADAASLEELHAMLDQYSNGRENSPY